MQTAEDRSETRASDVGSRVSHTAFGSDVNSPKGPASLSVALLTGGQDRHYAVGLATALMRQNIALEVIGSDDVDGPEFQRNPRVRFLNLHGGNHRAGPLKRIGRILLFYARLLRYVAVAKPKIFHILWNNKLQLFDRTLLMMLYKSAGKKVFLTVHNVNAGRRDNTDSWLRSE